MKIQMATPKFIVTLPSTGEKIECRPFYMKEEKVLLFATEAETEEEVVAAVDEIVHQCTFQKVSVKTHPAFDIQYVFLQLRAKSVSELAEFYLVCGECDHKTEARLDLTEIKVTTDPKHTNKIQLTENVWVLMKYPTLMDTVKANELSELEDVYRIVVSCMDKIIMDDEVHSCKEMKVEEVIEFLDNLTLEQFAKIRDFFTTMPKLLHKMEYTCPKCQTENETVLDGLLSFFA